MCIAQSRARRALPIAFGVLTFVSVGVLLTGDAFPRLFPSVSHEILAPLPLVLITLAYVVYQAGGRASRLEWAKTAILALGFLFWAANQLWPDCRLSTLFNDIAIAAFVLDAFLAMIGWSSDKARANLAERAAPPGHSRAPEEPLTSHAAEHT
jgi:hypothetical protein